ncbi:hypothetical protein [Mesorhizobium sp. CAU 1741]|uniref:COG3904 family protein n=1 Tax=Mesorhizobium sp. CAU 1741 TaxID=3140366 RepID=UPI00325C14C3
MSDDQATFGGQRSRNPLARYLARFDDGELVRCSFWGLFVGAVIVIGLDLKALYEDPALDPNPTGGTVYVEPALPPALRPGSPMEQPLDPRDNITIDDAGLRQPMRFDLGSGGVLTAVGSIDQGSAQRFAQEIETRGEYVTTLALNSPGGSLDDAMAMARLVRERGIGVEVADGALCASSCPLVLAGGVTRTVGDNAAIGLHQFYSVTDLSTTNPAQAMSDAQATAARISRYLAEMDVDPALWLHALDTPPRALYYLSQEEMARYRLVTSGSPVASQ